MTKINEHDEYDRFPRSIPTMGLDIAKSFAYVGVAASEAAEGFREITKLLNSRNFSDAINSFFASEQERIRREREEARWRNDPLELKKTYLQPFINEFATQLHKTGRALMRNASRMKSN